MSRPLSRSLPNGDPLTRHQPPDDPTRLRGLPRRYPRSRDGFVLAAVLIPLVLVLVGGNPKDPRGIALGFALLATALGVNRRLVRRTYPTWLSTTPGFLYLAAVAVLRHVDGARDPLLAATVLLPVVWVGRWGSRVQVFSILLGVAAVFDLPVLLLDDVRYAVSDVGHGFVLSLIGAAIGLSLVRSHERLRITRDALASTENRFQSMFEAAPIGTALVDQNGIVVMANAAYVDLFSVGRTLQRPLVDLVHAEDVDDVRRSLAAVFAGEIAQAQTRRRHPSADGIDRWLEVRKSLIRDARGNPEYVLVHALDVTERAEFEAQLHFQANHDALTGLFNRRGFTDALTRHVSLADRYGPSGALLMLDLDGFKRVNDRLGHAAGDALLIDVAHALSLRLRDTDVVARLGGDEFAVLLPHTTTDQALSVAQAIVETVGRVVAQDETIKLNVTASLGISVFHPGSTTESALFAADLAMYRAKEAGKNQVVLADSPPSSTESLRPEMSPSPVAWTETHRAEVARSAQRPADSARDALSRRTLDHEEIAQTWIERVTAWLDSDPSVVEVEPTIDLRAGSDAEYEVRIRVKAAPATLTSLGSEVSGQ